MKIAVVKHVDGYSYFATNRNAAKSAAVRLVLNQIEAFGERIYSLEGQEPAEMCQKIRNSSDSYRTAVEEGYIREEQVCDG